MQEWGFDRTPYLELARLGVIEHAALDGSRAVCFADGSVFTVDMATGAVQRGGDVPAVAGRVCATSHGTVVGLDDGGTLWRFTDGLERHAVALPPGSWGPLMRFAPDPRHAVTWIADQDEVCSSCTTVRSSRRDALPAPVKAMAVAPDGRLFGACGDWIARCFTSDVDGVRDLGVAVRPSCNPDGTAGTFADADCGIDGQIHFAEDDEGGHLDLVPAHQRLLTRTRRRVWRGPPDIHQSGGGSGTATLLRPRDACSTSEHSRVRPTRHRCLRTRRRLRRPAARRRPAVDPGHADRRRVPAPGRARRRGPLAGRRGKAFHRRRRRDACAPPRSDHTVKVDVGACARHDATGSGSRARRAVRRPAAPHRARPGRRHGRCGSASSPAPTGRPATSPPTGTSPPAATSTPCCTSATTSTSTAPAASAAGPGRSGRTSRRTRSSRLADYRIRHASTSRTRTSRRCTPPCR